MKRCIFIDQQTHISFAFFAPLREKRR